MNLRSARQGYGTGNLKRGSPCNDEITIDVVLDGALSGNNALAEEKELEAARAELKARKDKLEKSEEQLSRLQFSKVEIQNEAARLNEIYENAKKVATAAEADVAIAMSLAEEAVALEVQAAQRVSDSEIALHKAEVSQKDAAQAAAVLSAVNIAEKLSLQVAKTAEVLLLETELKQEDGEGIVRVEAEVEEKVRIHAPV